MTKVLGLDVSKSSVSCCLLLTRPTDPKQYYYECDFFKLEATAAGIKKLLELNPDVAVMDPTGVNYSRLWGTYLARAGIEVRLVGHKQLRSYRAGHLGLPDKDDDADALALACYCFDYLLEPRRFVQIRDASIARIRQLVLRLAHLTRVQSPIINRLRQDLAWQFPEVALVKSVRSKTGEIPLLWGWLAGERTSTRYEKLYAQTVGLGLTPAVTHHGASLCDLQREELSIELELKSLIRLPQFNRYCRVFARFGFGLRMQSLLLSQIYPFENYLVDGKPDIKIRKGRKSGKPTKRHLSRRRFEKALGVAPTEESSGDSKRSRVVDGSSLCRMAFWQWVFTRIEPRNQRLKNEIGERLGEQLDAEKAAGRPIKLVRSRIASLAARLLFREFAKEFCSDNC
ncbi:IS110 family transposase [Microseira wollei]|uniref:Transposase n=1 Tax=Microseira wollei NIES-4236 TaxID=2530354 RepID=A0AAV3XIX3_9CYAN|nr:transposase [Microseira wollei]GET40469.1 hypothetical protein MicvaDRAFT_1744 [Microseira wollei NIES-4236]